MSRAATLRGRIWWRRLRGSLPALRLGSGLVLFAFAATHFINHALGLISLEVMQAGQDLRLMVTRSLLGTAVLSGAALVHFTLGLGRLVQLRSLHIGPRTAIQLIFGLVIPLFLIRHVLATRGVHEFSGVTDNYTYVLWATWPGEAVRQAILMGLVWIHGCIGIHMWLAPKPWYRRVVWALYTLAVLIPALSYAGYVTEGRVVRLMGAFGRPLSPEQSLAARQSLQQGAWVYGMILAGATAVWILALIANRMGAHVKVRYADGPTISAARGLSVLEISRMNRIPHASVCGGRARCSTCRVRVTEGLEDLPPPSAAEQEVLRRVGAPANVRLGCQLRPVADVTVSTLLPANPTGDEPGRFDKYHWGVEREVSILFCDLRGFTQISEGRLSFDVVFVLNQFLGRMAEAIEDSGGFVDKFMGDGVMAIFGMDTPPAEGARQALAAARAMGGVLESLNQSLREEMQVPLSIGIGIHSGAAILGRIGAAAHSTEAMARLTALGETVNIASRLEQKTKDLGVQVAVSARAMALSGLVPGPKVVAKTVEIRGLSQPMEIFAAARATSLPQPG